MRANWLKSEDKNMNFHKCTSQQRRMNTIKNLECGDGRVIEEQEEMAMVARNFFEDLFTTREGTNDMNYIILGVVRIVTKESNIELIAPFTEEGFGALKDMRPTKASRIDGFPVIFFQKFWHIVGNEVLFYLDILNNGTSLELVNVTNIVIILKIPNLTSMANF